MTGRHVVLSIACALATLPAFAAVDTSSTDAQAPVTEAERLAEELADVRQKQAELSNALAVVTAAPATRSTYHLAGYGFVDFVAPQSGSGSFTQASFNPIFHALYDDRILFEGELAINVDADGGTEVALEYASIGWLLHENVALVAGRFLSPLGYFRQNLHPAWINRMASTPAGFGHDGAAPTGELGVQLRGGFSTTPAGRLNYALYVGNGPELEAGAEGVMAVMSEGVARDLDGSLVGGGRIGWLPVPQLELGLSAAAGRTSVVSLDGEQVNDDPSRTYRFTGADAAWRPIRDLELRGEYVRQKVGAASSSVAGDEAVWRAWYLQATYRRGALPWEVTARFGDFTTPEEDEAVSQSALGVNYWLGSSTVIRATYEFNDPAVPDSEIGDRLLVQFAHGF